MNAVSGMFGQQRRAAARAAMLGELLTASHTATLEDLPALVSRHAARVGLTDVTIYLSDLQQEVLSPLRPCPAASGDAVRGQLRMDGTVAGRAYQHGRVLPATAGRPRRWWVPLLDGTDRLGVLCVAGPDPSADSAVLADMERLAALVALMVVSKRTLSDSYARLVRRRRMAVAAEMEWRVMPPRTFATDRLVISAVMEPAYDVSGDVFDYAYDGRDAYLAVFDAMGHDTAAGLTANLAIATARTARSEDHGLASTARAVDEALVAQFRGDRFATGLLATLNVATGELEWISRGHLPPVIIRGRSTVELDCAPSAPMGTGLEVPGELCRTQLEPGDRLVFYTDGITEARNRAGEEFGHVQFTDFLIRHQADELPLPETLRRLMRRHMEHHHGHLEDDTTLLLTEWHGPAPYPPGEAEDLAGLPPRP